MNNKHRGLALIFNQKQFCKKLELPERSGTESDGRNLENRLKDLGFEVKSYDSYEQAQHDVPPAAQADHSDADCFLLVFLSHGEDEHVYARDGKISIKEIVSKFKGTECRSLVGKPKIFIWETCRADQPDDPVTACAAGNSEEKNKTVVHTLPAGADFIMCYSAAEGYYSHWETDNGSWYIQDLCELLGEYGDCLEFTHLLSLVNRKVSQRNVEMSRDENESKKQVPCFASMLTKKLYFRPKKC
ncbi:caspase-6-like [Anabas testudineus]|uniref:caspase-6-like n=1 Tax=Anabas testudineus TaxID=64144 RepID=UPI000E455E57|nr:caspase-6-like [Anabas testudineus]